MNFKKALQHEIKIKASDNNGYIVTIGCGEYVYSNPNDLIKDLKEYLKDPEKMEKKYHCLLYTSPSPRDRS